jgi:hypothetical protein
MWPFDYFSRSARRSRSNARYIKRALETGENVSYDSDDEVETRNVNKAGDPVGTEYPKSRFYPAPLTLEEAFDEQQRWYRQWLLLQELDVENPHVTVHDYHAEEYSKDDGGER